MQFVCEKLNGEGGVVELTGSPNCSYVSWQLPKFCHVYMLRKFNINYEIICIKDYDTNFSLKV